MVDPCGGSGEACGTTPVVEVRPVVTVVAGFGREDDLSQCEAPPIGVVECEADEPPLTA